MATVIEQAVAIRSTACARPSLGASSRANSSIRGLRMRRALASAHMAHFDRRRHAHVHGIRGRIVEAYPHRKTLSHHDPVQIPAYFRQARTLLVRGLHTSTETLNPAVKRTITLGHGPHCGPVAYGNARELRFAKVRDRVPGIRLD